VEVAGVAEREVDGALRPTLLARCLPRTGRHYEVHLEPDTREVVGVVGLIPRLDRLPARDGRPAPTWFDAVEGEARTARQAFITFGRGYHLPRRDLLAKAIHWPSLLAQALAEGRYPAGTTEARVRDDWIEVFVGMSKHRTPGDCDDLLFQIFTTSALESQDDGSVLLRTLPVYGGHAYRLRPIEGRWYIVRID
jgi:hypothetical protein